MSGTKMHDGPPLNATGTNADSNEVVQIIMNLCENDRSAIGWASIDVEGWVLLLTNTVHKIFVKLNIWKINPINLIVYLSY